MNAEEQLLTLQQASTSLSECQYYIACLLKAETGNSRRKANIAAIQRILDMVDEDLYDLRFPYQLLVQISKEDNQ